MNTEKIATRSNKPAQGNRYICDMSNTGHKKPFSLMINMNMLTQTAIGVQMSNYYVMPQKIQPRKPHMNKMDVSIKR